jgi:hypothetical protein
VVGDPHDPTTEVGAPRAHPEHYDKGMSYSRSAGRGPPRRRRPAAPTASRRATYVAAPRCSRMSRAPEPRIFQEVDLRPVVAITPVRQRRGGASRSRTAVKSGLAAYIWTNDLKRAHNFSQTSRRAWSGSTRTTCATCAPRSAASRRPGLGHEGGYRSIDFYTDQQAVHITLGEAHNPTFGKADQEGAARMTRGEPTSSGFFVSQEAPIHSDNPGADAGRRAARHRALRVPRARRHRSRRVAGVLRRRAEPRPSRRRTRTPSTCGRSRSSSTTTSCCARGRSPRPPRSATAVRSPETWTGPSRSTPSSDAASNARAEGYTKGVGDSVRVEDPLGFPYEFFYAVEHVERLAWRYELHTPARSCASTTSTRSRPMSPVR